jgi:hypothetical protein
VLQLGEEKYEELKLQGFIYDISTLRLCYVDICQSAPLWFTRKNEAEKNHLESLLVDENFSNEVNHYLLVVYLNRADRGDDSEIGLKILTQSV